MGGPKSIPRFSASFAPISKVLQAAGYIFGSLTIIPSMWLKFIEKGGVCISKGCKGAKCMVKQTRVPDGKSLFGPLVKKLNKICGVGSKLKKILHKGKKAPKHVQSAKKMCLKKGGKNLLLAGRAKCKGLIKSPSKFKGCLFDFCNTKGSKAV